MESISIRTNMEKYNSLNASTRKILCVGLCCLDIISEVKEFPHEDTDQRCLDQRWQRGGNAANNSTVLGLLGAKPYYLGTIADSHEKSYLQTLGTYALYLLNEEEIILSGANYYPAGCALKSVELSSPLLIDCSKSVDRMIKGRFEPLLLRTDSIGYYYGRNVANVSEMMKYVNRHNEEQVKLEEITVRVSVEIEKAKPELECLIPLADVVFVAKDYAQYKGYTDMKDTIENIRKNAKKGAVIICPWGEKGASAKEENESLVSSPAFPPEKVVDTLGAGDTFNGATIFALNKGHNLKDAITFGCRVAGAKVGQRGWGTLKDTIKYLNESLPSVQSPTSNDVELSKSTSNDS
ncbi:unnamed protein product [Meganyctiphanes norvegica]|uniref:Carbohydrate kinase PfkB domain-containing protein n=1 Tax=Meganyctiphanes norvegica TaxID=48144 RepID=A0AAV2RWX7_MEGNR